MSAKLLHALTDENPDLQKQIGCMTGIFQLFDRHHIINPKRIASYSTQKRLPSGNSHFSGSNNEGEGHNARSLHTTKEKNLNKSVNNNQRISIDSSRVSFSTSSCSSSFSSVDCNKTAQLESSSFDGAVTQDTSSRDTSTNQSNVYAHMGRRSPDLRDVVKDSIYKETRGLSVKTMTKEEPASRIMKHRDSPRPLQLSKSVNGTLEVGNHMNQRTSVDLKDSLRVLNKHQETPRHSHDAREPPRSSYEARDGTSFSVSRDARRFSYDGRERPRSSFDSQDSFKSTTKLRELSRLSLDSRESTMRGSDSDSKSNSILKDFQRSNSNSYITSSPKQASESHKKNPSVVAKLMGLEALPSSKLTSEGQMGDDDSSKSCESTYELKHNSVSSTPRSSLKDSISPRLRNVDLAMKPVSNSQFPLEPAPWRQTDGGHDIPKPVSRSRESPPRGPASTLSVYAEIEKRLKELEFKQADKDLRALKQILDAMQAKGLLETKKEEDKGFASERNYDNPSQAILDQNVGVVNRRNPIRPVSPTTKGTSSRRTFESPIVIMKPAKLIERSGIPVSSVIPIDGISGLRKIRNGSSIERKKGRVSKDVTSKLNLRDPTDRPLNFTDKKTTIRNLRSAQTSAKSQHLSRENSVGFGRSSGPVSPRLPQKKIEVEKRSRPPIPSSDSSKSRRPSLKQTTESCSPGGKRRPKSRNSQQNDDQLSEVSSEARYFSHQGDETSHSQCSDSNISMTSQIDIEVTSADRSGEANTGFSHRSSQSPSKKVANHLNSSLKQKKPSPRLREEGLVAELITVAPEQPSPVSVLDATFYSDDLVSPERKISEPFKDDKTRSLTNPLCEEKCGPLNPLKLSDDRGTNISLEINQKKLENVEQLVQKLRRLNSNHNEATTDYIASLCENTNPDHRYISEILLASGLLLRDLGSGLNTIQLHQSGYPINPNLYSVLEQTKGSNGFSKYRRSREEKAHRKLIFDAVNESLERKLGLIGPSPELSFHANKLAGKTLNGQQLLKELCSEIDQLQANEDLYSSIDDDDNLKSILFKDVMKGEKWIDFHKEVSGMVLDIERQIFKDLVAEVVSGEAMSLRAKSSRHCRQLFAK